MKQRRAVPGSYGVGALIALSAAACGPISTPSGNGATQTVNVDLAGGSAQPANDQLTEPRPEYAEDGSAHVDPCDALSNETELALARASRQDPHLYETTRDAFRPFGRCFHTAHGAWAVGITDIEPVVLDLGATAREQGRWMLVHLAADGTRVERSPSLPTEGHDASGGGVNFVAGHPTTTTVGDPVFFDYDGDGEPEVVVVVSEQTHGYGTTTRGRVWTFRHGAIDVYPPARDYVVTNVRDVDNDGRPDLFVRGPWSGEWTDPCARQTVAVHGPELLAHSQRDGAFSTSDAAAVDAARAACPSRPAPVVAMNGADVDSARTASNVACARLWGQSSAQVAAAVRRGCHATRRAAQGCTRGCNDSGLLVRWAGASVPLRLR